MNKIKYMLLLGLTAGLFSQPASAQLSITGHGLVDLDTHEGAMVLGGLTVGRSGTGWSPIAGVSAYWLRYPIGETATNTVTAVAPTIGIRNNVGVGSYSLSAGYLFLNDEVSTNQSGALVGGGSNSPFVAFNASYWGNGSRLGQLYASYNLDDQFFNIDGRGLLRAGSSFGNRPLYYGMEAAILGGGDGPDKYFQGRFGPALQVNWNESFRTGVSAGIKIDNGPRSNPFPYIRFNFSVSP